MQMSLVALGGVSLALGVVALAFPLPASLSMVLFTGWAFLAIGALQMFSAFRSGELWRDGLWGLFPLVLGVLLIARPLDGMVVLTTMVGALFLLSGIFRLAMGFRIGHRYGWLVVVSGAVSLVLGAAVLVGFPASATVTLGLLLATELILIGIGLIVLGLARRP